MPANAVSGTIGRRYVLHESLGVGGMGAVYRATDRLTGQTVALKRVTTPAEQLVFGDRDRGTDPNLSLAQEFRTLASLRHPYIISVLDYGFDRQRCPFYTMDLLENTHTIVEAGQGPGLSTQVDLLVQTLQALAYLHRRSVMHRDLKPGNVLVVDGRVKVLDFGVSVVTSQTMEYITQTTVGTLAYLAPELFQGAPVTRAADLYAVGVMAYEMFAGRHPFDLTNMAALMFDAVSRPADVRSIGLGDQLAAVLERLLVKKREERYDDAEEVIRDLCAATGRSLPPETVEIRESYLQAARFVGREAELEQLSEALDAALAGSGSAWLVGGESGVGKSRLVDELRTRALVRGATVLRGQAVSEGGSPYHLWRNVVRWLALTTELDPGEESVLKPLVPDIAELVGRGVADAPPADPQIAQRRLFTVIAQVSHRGCLSQAAVILLEDLQWARSESLAFLDYLMRRVSGMPLLLIGSYRDDERGDLPNVLSGMQVLKLDRLSAAGVAKLSESMVGETGRNPKIVDLLQRETEGNPFFVVETVRALAERAGSLEEIGHAALPERVFAGGIQEVVQRRLSRVPSAAQPLLRLAAIAGRGLDLRLLRALALGVDLEEWLHTCADVAVLEADGAWWRFAHDKLREGVLDTIPEDARPALHRRVACAIEAVYPHVPEQMATLAHLWRIAGDEDRELHYARLAGEQAVRTSANVEAIGYFERALALLQTLPDTPERARQELALLLDLGVPITATKGYGAPEAQRVYGQALALCRQVGDTPQLFPALYGLWRFHLIRAEVQTAHELGQQLMHIAQTVQDPALVLEAHRALGCTFFHRGELIPARTHVEQGVALYDPQQHRAHAFLYGHDPAVSCLSYAAMALWLLGYPDQALERIREVLVLARGLSHPFSLAYALTFSANVHQFRGEVPDAQEYAEAAVALTTEQGFPFFLGMATTVRGWALVEQGQQEEGIAVMLQGLTTLDVVGSQVFHPRHLALLAEAYGKVGQAKEGLRLVAGALATIEATKERTLEADLYRTKGELLLLQGRAETEIELCFQRALEVARGQNARSLELRAATSLGRLWQGQGRKQEARALLQGIYGWFSEGFDTADLQEAKALLDELSLAD